MPEGPPPAPVVQRLSIRYAKRGRMRFASHRDVARAIERGVRKAGVPVAYSAGFSPHPRISYPGGAPTGSASEAEYLEISLTSRREPGHLGRLLDAALPDGIDVLDVVEAEASSARLRLEASRWEVLLPGVTATAARSAVGAFLAARTAIVERLTSKGRRQLDARAAVVSIEVGQTVESGQTVEGGQMVEGGQTVESGQSVGIDRSVGYAILRIVVRQLTPAVRPDDILAALGQFTKLVPVSPPLVTRTWQGPLEGDAEALPAGQLSARTPTPAFHDQVLADEQGLAVDQATRLESGSADSAPVVEARAIEQLSRGERAGFNGVRAREPNGRDCTNARNRATKPTARSR
jgi:radical SAM-linked protein